MTDSVNGMGGPQAAGLFSLHHIGIVTPRERYDDVVAKVIDCLGGSLEEEGGDKELDIQGSWIQVGSGLRLEVVTPRRDIDSPMTRFLSKTGGGLHHVSFETTEIGACKALALAGGASIIGESADHDGWAEHFIHPGHTGGALLHWMQALGK
ncbi:VOC family protein [Streptomyces sp. NPDC006197]|uniref:VOC family protein n=1 Tax=Streptomyces sp. NPDC006197 TaxID=3156685 RepID=UPI0033B78162